MVTPVQGVQQQQGCEIWDWKAHVGAAALELGNGTHKSLSRSLFLGSTM